MRKRVASVAVAAIAALATSPVLALDPAKAATAMAQKAAQAYEAGDHAQAAQLYLQAFRTDPKPDYVFAAARAEHVGGRLDEAEEHYRQFLAAPNIDSARAAKAQGYLADIQAARADQKAQDADKAARSENWKLAAQLYATAVQLAPGKSLYSFKAGVAAHQAGEFEAALGHFERYLQAAPPDAVDRQEAMVRAEQIRKARAPRPEAQPAAPPVPAAPVAVAPSAAAPVVNQQAPPSRSRVLPLTLLVVAGVAGAAGGTLWWGAADLRADLDQQLATKDAQGRISGTTYDAAEATLASIESRKTAAAVLWGTGGVAAAVGAWRWLATPDTQVAVWPAPGGAVVVARF